MVVGRGWNWELHGHGLSWYSIASTSTLQGMWGCTWVLTFFGGKKRWVPCRNDIPLFTSSSEKLLQSAEWTLPSLAAHPFLSLRRVWLWVADTAEFTRVVKSHGAAGNWALAQLKGQKQQCWGGKQPWGTKQWHGTTWMILLSGVCTVFHCLRPAGQGEPNVGSAREQIVESACHLVFVPAATENYMEVVNTCFCV